MARKCTFFHRIVCTSIGNWNTRKYQNMPDSMAEKVHQFDRQSKARYLSAFHLEQHHQTQYWQMQCHLLLRVSTSQVMLKFDPRLHSKISCRNQASMFYLL